VSTPAAEKIRLQMAYERAIKQGENPEPYLTQLKQFVQDNPSYPTRPNRIDVFPRPEGNPYLGERIDWVRHSGPASDLPETDWNQLYPSDVRPATKEFDFTRSASERFPTQESLSVGERSNRFINQYFGGQDPGQVINPATSRPYGNELRIHDAMHDFANVGNTLRDEELITIAEKVGTAPLGSLDIGLRGLTQQPFAQGFSPGWLHEDSLGGVRQNTRLGGPTLVQQRGASQGSSLFRDNNRVTSFLSPPISRDEFNTMVQRGQEFYDQVHGNFSGFRNADFFLKGSEGLTAPAVTQQIQGGYNTGGMPYGNYLSRMNAPLVPTVDPKKWRQALEAQLAPGAERLTKALEKEQEVYRSPEEVERRRLSEQWEDRATAMRFQEQNRDRPVADLREVVPAGIEVDSPEFQRDARVFNALMDKAREGGLQSRTTFEIMRDTLGEKPSYDKNAVLRLNNAVEGLTWDDKWDVSRGGDGPTSEKALAALREAVDQSRNLYGSGPTAAAGQGFLNPANLGSSVRNLSQSGKAVFEGAGLDPKELLLDTAAAAKQLQGYEKALPLVRGAIKAGFDAADDLTGSVPLFDPKFREAVEKGDVGAAARQVGTEYVAGTLAAPVVGAGMGVLQRVAPRAAAAAITGLNAVRIANPVAVVSQLGGDAPQPRAVGTYNGSTVYRNPPGAFVAAPLNGRPIRLGTAVRGGQQTFVPWGSVAGERRVGPKTVGRPWWDVGKYFGR